MAMKKMDEIFGKTNDADVSILSNETKNMCKFELATPSKENEGELVELAKEMEEAHNYVSACAISKLKTIQTQMKFLRQQAKQIILEAGINTKLHSLPCNLKKRVGSTYHVYKRGYGDYYISMLSPQEWGESMPHQYVASYRLEFDNSWQPVDEKSKFAATEILGLSETTTN